jgi:hypothetical protein
MKLFPQSIDGALTVPQQAQLRCRSRAPAKKVVDVSDELKLLPKIVSCYRK